jgi:hypothetical protein
VSSDVRCNRSAMELTAIFENWHVEDGNYPPLYRGELVSLSFELEPITIAKTSHDHTKELIHLGNAQYRFCGGVLKVYDSDLDSEIIVIKSSDFRFYVLSQEVGRYSPGDTVIGEGTLLLDHYIWVENREKYKDAPDLFYNLRVKQIRKVQTPERFIVRYKDGKSLPTRLAPSEYTGSDVEVIETMEGQPFDEEFYIIDFDSEGVEKEKIGPTFLG